MAEKATPAAAPRARPADASGSDLSVVAALFIAALVFRVPVLVVGPLLKDI